MTFTEVEEKL